MRGEKINEVGREFREVLNHLRKTLKRARDEGWMENINNLWADLDCFGTYNIVQNNCKICPLAYLCEEERRRTNNE